MRESVQSEDCLYLNVWTQTCDLRARQPVLLWFYGAGSEDACDGTRFASKLNSCNAQLPPRRILSPGSLHSRCEFRCARPFGDTFLGPGQSLNLAAIPRVSDLSSPRSSLNGQRHGRTELPKLSLPQTWKRRIGSATPNTYRGHQDSFS